MPTIYKHHNPDYSTLSFAQARQREINSQIEQLALEKQMWQRIIESTRKNVCPECSGEGVIMKPIEGCEVDGPRMHKCTKCDGTGFHTRDRSSNA